MRDIGNFTELIDILNEDIWHYKNAMATGEAKPDRFEDLRHVILLSSIDIAQAHYS